MRVTFVMTGYPWAPMGGYRVIYEYANQLANRGHKVTVVHPRRIESATPAPERSLYHWARGLAVKALYMRMKPAVDWHKIDERVQLLFVPALEQQFIPDGDAVVASGWQTAGPVVNLPVAKGNKFYLIQHYEACMGPADIVDATWRLPLRKIVISKWLLELGKKLTSDELTYIPNAIDHEHYRLTRPVEGRRPKVAMMFSKVPFKGAADGVEALRIAREKHPELSAVFFGTSRLKPKVPRWVEYYKNPPQDFIVREIYNNSSIFLCPSISEGFALPPAEAAACGCAVVATDNGGIRDFIESNITGLLSPPRDPKALADNISLLLENEGLRVGLAKACNSRVRGLSWERSASALERLVGDAAPALV